MTIWTRLDRSFDQPYSVPVSIIVASDRSTALCFDRIMYDFRDDVRIVGGSDNLGTKRLESSTAVAIDWAIDWFAMES